MLWPLTGATHLHAQLGPSDKGCTIKGLVVCYVMWLDGSLDKRKVGGLVPECGQDGYQAQVSQLPIHISQRMVKVGGINDLAVWFGYSLQGYQYKKIRQFCYHTLYIIA